MRIAIVGCGHIAEAHLRFLRRIRGSEVVAVCDLDEERARDLAAAYRVPSVFEDPGRMVDETAPEVVHVLTPPASHAPVVSAVAREGTTVLVEKPLAMNEAEAESMLARASGIGASLSVCHNYLYMQAVAKALDLARSGALGEILSADLYWRATSLEGQVEDPSGWAHRLPGGLFHEVAPHSVYLLEAFLGELTVVGARVAHRGPHPGELRAAVEGRCSAGSFTVRLDGQPASKHLRIRGSRMSLQVDIAANLLVRLRPWSVKPSGRAMLSYDRALQALAGTTWNVARGLTGRMPRTHFEFLKQLYAALGRGEPPPVRGEDGLSNVKALDQVWKLLENSET